MNTYVNQALLFTNSQPNDLISGYFSDANMQIVQKKLRNEVKKQTNLSIDNQSCDEIYQVMLFVFRTYGRNVTSNVKQEIQYLNDIVIHTLTPDVVSNVLQYINYIKDISKLPVPIEHGTSTSIKGNNSLAMKEKLF